MRRPKSRYAPHLVTISETATMSVSKEKEFPIAKTRDQVSSTRSCGARMERSLSVPPEAEATDRQMSAPKPVRSKSAKCLSINNLHKPKPASTETRSTSPIAQPNKPAPPKAYKSNKYGRSSLHNAVRKGDKRVIKTLLDTKPELLMKADNRGNHPLHYAASPNVPDGATIVYMLLKAGAAVNALNDRQQTPLLISVISSEDDNDKVARVLLYHHANPMIKVTDDLMLAQYAKSRELHKVAAAIREYM